MKLTAEQNEQLNRNIESELAFYRGRIDDGSKEGAMVSSVTSTVSELVKTAIAYSANGYQLAENLPVVAMNGYCQAHFIKPIHMQEDDIKKIKQRVRKQLETQIEAEKQLAIEREIQRRLAQEEEAERQAAEAIITAKREAIKAQVLSEMK